MAATKNNTLTALALASVVACTFGNAQWGTGGGIGAYSENDEIPITSRKMMKGAKDVLDDIHGFDDGERPATEHGRPNFGADESGFDSMEEQEDGTKTFRMRKQSGGGGAGPAPREDEFVDSWMPSARKGFEVPERYRQSLNVQRSRTVNADKDASEDDDEDVEEILNERARKEMPKHAPGVQTRRIDKCLRAVAKFCSFNSMDANFAEFSQCVFDVRFRVKQQCFEWCEAQGRCSADMREHCPKKSPMDTTECMLKKKSALTEDCVDSPYYKSLEEGIDDMRRDRKAAQENRAGRSHGMGSASPESDDGERFASESKDTAHRGDDASQSGDEEDDAGLDVGATEVLSTTFHDEDEL